MKSVICGQILEDIVFYQLIKDFECPRPMDRTHEVTKYRDVSGKEVNLVIMDFENKTVLLIEVKLSEKIIGGQRKYLLDEDVCRNIEKKAGMPIANKAVIYLGENGETEDGILYINAEDFLKGSREMALALLKYPQITEFRLLADILDGNDAELEKEQDI